jgi:hypothetical protein
MLQAPFRRSPSALGDEPRTQVEQNRRRSLNGNFLRRLDQFNGLFDTPKLE